jgi:hypothetical protein
MMDVEIASFVKEISAVRIDLQGCDYRERWRFSKPNYFQIGAIRLIIKIRKIKASQRPFWGVGVRQIEILERLGPYYLVLLTSDREGWFLSHTEIAAHIKNLEAGTKNPGWSRGTKGSKSDNENQYKINPPLPDENIFKSSEEFLQKMRLNRTEVEAEKVIG